MHENEISGLIIGAAIEVHRHFGPGLVEKVYTYLRLSNLRLGLIINYHSFKLTDGIVRVVNGLDEPLVPGSFRI